jgi:hypothetical protein
LDDAVGIVRLVSFIALLFMATAVRAECESTGQLEFVCGPKRPQDLVRVPDTSWIIASSFVRCDGFYLIDSRDRGFRVLP